MHFAACLSTSRAYCILSGAVFLGKVRLIRPHPLLDSFMLSTTEQWQSHELTPSLFLQKYANHDLIKYLESIGAEFGACQNAYTSADDTVYEFMVPTDDADLQILDRSFDVFAEFATKIRQAQRPLAQDAEHDVCPCYGVTDGLVDKLCHPSGYPSTSQSMLHLICSK